MNGVKPISNLKSVISFVIGFVVVGAFVGLVVSEIRFGHQQNENQNTNELRKSKEKLQSESERVAKILVEQIKYVKDSRTGLCFAYYWSDWNSGPALATVPCESVPVHLLTVVELPEVKK